MLDGFGLTGRRALTFAEAAAAVGDAAGGERVRAGGPSFSPR